MAEDRFVLIRINLNQFSNLNEIETSNWNGVGESFQSKSIQDLDRRIWEINCSSFQILKYNIGPLMVDCTS